MSVKRNGDIDFFRFVFSLIIMFAHFHSSFKMNFFPNGHNGVDFFFVISGFFMANHSSRVKLENNDLSHVSDETWVFILNKIKNFYAYYISAIFLQIFVRYWLLNHESGSKILIRCFQSIPIFSLTFLGLGLGGENLYVSNTWYLSAMIISIFLLYPFLLRYYKFSTQTLFPILAVVVIGYLIGTYKCLPDFNVWSGFVYCGILRALAIMALGASIFQLSNVIKEKCQFFYDNSLLIKILFSSAKYFCYFIVLSFTYGSCFGITFSAGFNLHSLLLCSIGILLSLSGIGFSIPDCKLIRFLGKQSLAIFIYHGLIRSVLLEQLGATVSTNKFFGLIILTVILSIILMFITDLVKRKIFNLFAEIC